VLGGVRRVEVGLLRLGAEVHLDGVEDGREVGGLQPGGELGEGGAEAGVLPLDDAGLDGRLDAARLPRLVRLHRLDERRHKRGVELAFDERRALEHGGDGVVGAILYARYLELAELVGLQRVEGGLVEGRDAVGRVDERRARLELLPRLDGLRDEHAEDEDEDGEQGEDAEPEGELVGLCDRRLGLDARRRLLGELGLHLGGARRSLLEDAVDLDVLERRRGDADGEGVVLLLQLVDALLGGGGGGRLGHARKPLHLGVGLELADLPLERLLDADERGGGRLVLGAVAEHVERQLPAAQDDPPVRVLLGEGELLLLLLLELEPLRRSRVRLLEPLLLLEVREEHRLRDLDDAAHVLPHHVDERSDVLKRVLVVRETIDNHADLLVRNELGEHLERALDRLELGALPERFAAGVARVGPPRR